MNKQETKSFLNGVNLVLSGFVYFGSMTLMMLGFYHSEPLVFAFGSVVLTNMTLINLIK